MANMEPFMTVYDNEKEILTNYSIFEERKISDLKNYFVNEVERQKIEDKENLIVYKVFRQDVPLTEGELLHCLTVISPGNVDGEFFMTKGHYHKSEKCAEIYHCLKGEGLLLMQKGNESRVMEFKPSTIAYIPAGWGHRTVNVSSTSSLVFFSVWPGQSGYDYERTMKEPFQKSIFLENNGYKIK